MLGYLQQAYWRWIPSAERAAGVAPRLEAVLRAGLDAATDAEPEVGLVHRAARHGADAGDARMAERSGRKTEESPG